MKNNYKELVINHKSIICMYVQDAYIPALIKLVSGSVLIVNKENDGVHYGYSVKLADKHNPSDPKVIRGKTLSVLIANIEQINYEIVEFED
jgi:hypothetical protein